MVDYTRLAATAKRLIEDNGRLVTLYRWDRTPADPTKPYEGPDTTPTSPDGDVMGPVKVAFVPASGSGFGEVLANEQGQLTIRIDQVGLLAADSIMALSPVPNETDPSRYDALTDGSTALRIARVGRLQPGSTVLLYVLGLVG